MITKILNLRLLFLQLKKGYASISGPNNTTALYATALMIIFNDRYLKDKAMELKVMMK